MATPAFSTSGLEQRVRERADMVGSLFVSSSEIQSYLEASWQELYGMASQENEDLLVSIGSTSTTAGIGLVSLSGLNDIKRLRGIRIHGDDFLSPLSLREVQNLDRTGRSGRPRFYWFYSATQTAKLPALEILPTPDGVYSLDIYYQPALQLVDVSNLGLAPLTALANWDEFLVVSAAIKCKDKEESSVSVLMSEKQNLLASIRANWAPMDVSEGQRIVSMNLTRRSMRAYDYTGPDDDY